MRRQPGLRAFYAILSFELQLKHPKGDSLGDYIGECTRVITGDARSLDYSSFF